MPELKIDWNQAPTWANYAAMDENGNWWWYAEKPALIPPRIWDSQGVKEQFKEPPYWKNSLTERDVPLDYTDWHDLHEDEIALEAAESGQDRETGFDMEELMERKYQQYIDKFNTRGTT